MRLKPLSLEPEGIVSRTLSFEDNARCAVLFGRHHENLALVEQHLPVTLAARGNLVTISGEPEPADAAAREPAQLRQDLVTRIALNPIQTTRVDRDHRALHVD